MNFKFDWTINFPVLFTVVGVLVGIGRIWLQQRDFNRELLVILGKRAPRDDRSGVLGDIAHLLERTDIHEEMIDAHHHELRLDRRHHQRRSVPPT